MFTGLVEYLGTVRQSVADAHGQRLVLEAAPWCPAPAVGESIAVNGCCLTLVRADPQEWEFQVGPETLARTNLGALRPGSRVNLERALAFGDRLGGHLVSGHVDAVGRLVERAAEGEFTQCWFQAPAGLLPQMISQGSIAVDGVSLTIAQLLGDRFRVMLIPHTLAVTTLGRLCAGDLVNLETDLLAKYVERQLAPRPAAHGSV